MKSYFIMSLGCKLSQFDAAAFGERMRSARLKPAAIPADSDLIVISSCTVTSKSDAQSRQLIRKVIRENPGTLVAVMGCYARREAERIASIPGVDLVIADSYHPDLPATILSMGGKGEKARVLPPAEAGENFFPITGFGTRTRPFVKVQDGCNAHCSYCVVRLVRGKSRSVPAEQVLSQVRLLGEKGFKEIVLTGINIGLWGKDLPGHRALLDLLRILEKSGGVPRIRMSSIEPSDISEAFIDFMADSSVMMEHFHVPLQSGSEKVLRRMHRPYTAAAYRDLIRAIQEKIPDAGLGTDIITGFPGEDERAFSETHDFVASLPFSYLHVFSYSERPNTGAASLDGKVHGTSIRKRTNRLRALSRKKNFVFRKRFLNHHLSCLVLHEKGPQGTLSCLSRNYIRITAPGDTASENAIVQVRIGEVTGKETLGTVTRVES